MGMSVLSSSRRRQHPPRLRLEYLDGILLFVEVLGAEHIVLFLLQEPELAALRGLRPLLVRLALHGVAEGRHAGGGCRSPAAPA